MLKSIYDKYEDIPEGERQHYSLRTGKYVLELDEHHPVLINNKQLKSEKSTDQAKITRLTNEKAALEGSTLPQGHVAVTTADKQQLDAYRPLGTPEELTRIKTEHGELKIKDETRSNEDHLRQIAAVMGWDFDALKLVPGLPQMEVRDVTENGKPALDANGKQKKMVIAKIKSGENSFVEKPFQEVFDETPTLKIFEPSLKPNQQQQQQQPTTTWARQGTTDLSSAEAGDIVSQRLNQRNQSRQQAPNPLMPQQQQVAAAQQASNTNTGALK